MSISSEITRISNNVQNTIDTIEATGVTVPEGANSDDLPSLAQALANTKQDKLTGVEGQIVGFDESGNAVAQEAPSGLPTGGTPGQMLYQGESGAEWGDKPVMYVNITESGGTYSADKTLAEISEYHNSGFAIYASFPFDVTYTVPLASLQSNYSVIFMMFLGSTYIRITVFVDGTVSVDMGSVPAAEISFTPGTTGLTSDNVQDAIEEVNEKIPSAPKSVAVTLSSTGWSNNQQTVTVQGVKTSGQSVRISPAAKTDADSWVAAGVWCNEPTTANQLVFICDAAPTENINVNVELQEVQSG